MSNIKVALTNLGKYNEGELSYVWLDLPASDEELTKALEAIEVAPNSEYEEYFITDYEAPFQIGEYESLTKLNEMAEEMDELSGEELSIIEAYMEEVNNDYEEAMETINGGEYSIYHECSNMAEVAMAMVDEGLFGEFDERDTLHRYIDYDALGRDLNIEGTYVYVKGDYVEFQQ